MAARRKLRSYRTVEQSRKVLGENLRWLRLFNRLTQESLGALVKMTRSRIGRVERGEQDIQVDALDRIAAALGVALWELLIPRDDADK